MMTCAGTNNHTPSEDETVTLLVATLLLFRDKSKDNHQNEPDCTSLHDQCTNKRLILKAARWSKKHPCGSWSWLLARTSLYLLIGNVLHWKAFVNQRNGIV